MVLPVHMRLSLFLLSAAAIVVLLTPALPGSQTPPTSTALTFEDISDSAGIHFVHTMGKSARKHLPETMGSGVVWLDYDGDGFWDLYFVDSGFLRDSSGAEARLASERPVMNNTLYRGNAEGTFNVATAAGTADPGFGQGAAAADYDGDGWTDLLVTNYGANTLYRNNGDGTFSDVTSEAGVGDTGWGVSAAWGDLDTDGFPDLYVTNYLVYELENAPYCRDSGSDLLSYCHVALFEGQSDLLYHNRGDGTFLDITAAAGVAIAGPIDGKGLGVVMGDLDENGLSDIYVANDMTPNFLYLNRGNLTFEDLGLAAGVGLSQEGMPQAGMGVDLGDMDGDGHLDIVVTNFDSQPNNFYRTYGPGFFLDDAYSLGIGDSSFFRLGFGVAMVDIDGDGALDLHVANGHILDVIEHLRDNITYEQPNQVFRNRLDELRATAIATGELVPPDPAAWARESTFAAGAAAFGEMTEATGWRPNRALLADVSEAAGPAITRERVSRGLAIADIDGDGWPDVALSNSDGPAELLRNTTARASQRLVLRFRGRGSNRDAFGTRAWVTPLREGKGSAGSHGRQAGSSAEGSTSPAGEGAVGFTQVFEIKSASSYCSQNATDLYVGLGSATGAIIEIRWPGGEVERLDPVAAGQLVLIVEGRGVVASRPLRSF